MSQYVVSVERLTRRFGKKLALDEVSLDIEPGCVYGLVGENGAGKTTLLKHLMGLYRPQAGAVRIFGLSPIEYPVEVLSQVGYLSEDRTLPEWMTIAELIDYTAAFYPTWDHTFAAELQAMFELSDDQRAKSLSRGQRARIGLLLALAYRPALLVLDEPSSGLDAIVRKDILSAIIRTVADDGRTVLFSSHLLDEVQRVSDKFAILHNGRLLLSGDMDEVLQSHERITVRFGEPQSSLPFIGGSSHLDGEGRDWSVLCNGDREDVAKSLVEAGGEIVERRTPTLEEVFVAKAKTNPALTEE